MTKPEVSDKEFIEDPSRWPYWPLLPVKKRIEGGFPWQCGIIQAVEGQLSTIVLDVTIWDKNLEEKIGSAEKKAYPSVDEMLADGWMCD